MTATPAPQGLTVSFDTAAPRPPCVVCGTPAEKHGSYPTCATHPYTATFECGAVGVFASGKTIGLPCPGSACVQGCVRAAPTPSVVPAEPYTMITAETLNRHVSPGISLGHELARLAEYDKTRATGTLFVRSDDRNYMDTEPLAAVGAKGKS